MKRHSWTLIFISLSLIFLVACDPSQFSQVGVPQPRTVETEAEEEAMETKEEDVASLNLPGEDVELTGGTLALDGTGQPGNEIQVVVDGEVVGRAEVNNDGIWSIETSEIETGDHQIQIQTLNSAGAVASETEAVPVSVAAPMTSTNPPELVFPVDGADLLIGQVTIVGSGDVGTEVEILDGATVLGEAVVNAEGDWTYTFEPDEGEHQYSARIPGDETATSGVVEVMVTSDTDLVDCNFSNPGINRGETYIVGTCDTLVEISQDLGLEFDDLIEVNPQLDSDYSLIFPGQILNLP